MCDSTNEMIENAEKKLKQIVNFLDWNYEELTKQESGQIMQCPFNSNHLVRKTNWNRHKIKCNKDVPYPKSLPGNPSIQMTPELQQHVIKEAVEKHSINADLSVIRPVPRSSTEYTKLFTREEKLALYEYAVAHTKRKDILQDFSFSEETEDKEEKKEMSELELAAAQRDAKRRRVSYRNRIYTQKKSHSEVMREVIESKLEQLRTHSSK